MTGKQHTEQASSRPKWTFEHTVSTTASADKVWQVWASFDSRSDWDAVHRATLNGPFAAGTTGEWLPIVSKRFPPMELWIEEVVDGERFVLGSSHQRRLAEVHYHHELSTADSGSTLITHRLEITGPLGAFIGRIAGEKMASAMPAAMQRLAHQAELDE